MTVEVFRNPSEFNFKDITVFSTIFTSSARADKVQVYFIDSGSNVKPNFFGVAIEQDSEVATVRFNTLKSLRSSLMK